VQNEAGMLPLKLGDRLYVLQKNESRWIGEIIASGKQVLTGLFVLPPSQWDIFFCFVDNTLTLKGPCNAKQSYA
jgi:hypothetical protein